MMLRRLWTLAIPVLATLIVLAVGAAQPRFLAWENLGNVAGQSAPLVIFTLAQMIPILSRGLDLSQGGVVVATSVAFALLAKIVGTDAAAGLALGVGLVAGLANGAVVSGLSVSPFVATLGIGSVLQGLALVAANGQPISDTPADFNTLFYTRVLGIALPVWVAIILAVGQAFVLGRTLLGRYIYAIGSNERAAFLSGVPVRGGVLFAYAASGVLTSVGAVLLSSRISSGHPTAGSDTALQAVAAAVIGGVSLFGGRGGVAGAVVGAVFLGLLSNALNLLGVSSFLQLVAVGLAIIAAVIVDRARLSAAQQGAAPIGRGALIGLGVVALAVLAALMWRANAGARHGPRAIVRVGPAEVHLSADQPLNSPTPRRRYRIGVLFPFLAAPFWVNEAYGLTDEAAKLGVDIIWLSADGYDNIDKQNSQIEDLTARHVDAILLAATSVTGNIQAVERATAAGVPVFGQVTSTDAPHMLSVVYDDDVEIGREQARYMGQALHGRGKVAMLDGPAAGEWSIRRVKGFKEVMAAQYPGIQIVDEKFSSPERPSAQKLMEDILAANPVLDGVFTVADSMALGAADAASHAGRLDQLVITTTSFSKEALPYLKSGAIKVDVDENPVLMGRVALDNVVRGLNGDPVPKILYVPSPAMTADSAKTITANHWAPEAWRLK